MTRKPLHRSAAAVVVALLFLTLVPAAHAVDGRLEFSTDGMIWTSTPPEALFDGDVVLVPGGSATGTLYLRSTAQTPGALDVAITNVRASDEDAARSFGVRTVTDAGTGIDGADVGPPRTPLADLAEYTSVGPTLTLEPGQSATFTLTIDLELRPGGTGAQNSTVGLDLAISFRDAAAVAGGGPGIEKAGPPEGEPVPTHLVPALPQNRNEATPDRAATGPSTTDATSHDASPAPAEERGFLAVTGIARSAIIAGIAVSVLGAVLWLASRRGRERS